MTTQFEWRSQCACFSFWSVTSSLTNYLRWETFVTNSGICETAFYEINGEKEWKRNCKKIIQFVVCRRKNRARKSNSVWFGKHNNFIQIIGLIKINIFRYWRFFFRYISTIRCLKRLQSALLILESHTDVESFTLHFFFIHLWQYVFLPFLFMDSLL